MRLLAMCGATLLACAGTSGGDEGRLLVFTDWIRIDAECGSYSFRAPPDTVELAAQGTDSCREAWTTRSCQYTGGYSSFESDLSGYAEQLEYEEVQELIDGQEATLVKAVLAEAVLAEVEPAEPRFMAGVTLAIADPELEGARLTLEARCEDEAGQLDALSVFRTITFRR